MEYEPPSYIRVHKGFEAKTCQPGDLKRGETPHTPFTPTNQPIIVVAFPDREQNTPAPKGRLKRKTLPPGGVESELRGAKTGLGGYLVGHNSPS